MMLLNRRQNFGLVGIPILFGLPGPVPKRTYPGLARQAWLVRVTIWQKHWHGSFIPFHEHFTSVGSHFVRTQENARTQERSSVPSMWLELQGFHNLKMTMIGYMRRLDGRQRQRLRRQLSLEHQLSCEFYTSTLQHCDSESGVKLRNWHWQVQSRRREGLSASVCQVSSNGRMMSSSVCPSSLPNLKSRKWRKHWKWDIEISASDVLSFKFRDRLESDLKRKNVWEQFKSG